MDTVILVLIFVVTLCFLIYKRVTRHYGYLESLGIPVVAPRLGLGSPPFALHSVKHHEHPGTFLKDNLTAGSYMGSMPAIWTIDPEILKDVLITKFNSFRARDVTIYPEEYTTLDLAEGEVWKTIRKALSPTFTSGKLKLMTDPIANEVNRLIKHIKNKNFHDQQAFTLDVIGKCAYNVEFGALQEDKLHKPKILNDLQGYIDSQNVVPDAFTSAMYLMILAEPKLSIWLEAYPKEMFEYIKGVTKSIMNQRDEADMASSGDFIDVMRNLRNSVKADKSSVVTEEMVYVQGMIFLAAGYETTSTTLSLMTYVLATRPDIQQKMRDEIESVIENIDEIDHTSISNLPYVEACIKEVQRLYPAVHQNSRVCTNDIEIKGIKIKAGTYIFIPIYTMHRRKEFYGEDAEDFVPERFLDGRVPHDQITYHPFGAGPRVCIGMRFAMAQMKIVLAKLLTTFKIMEVPGVTKLDFDPGSMFVLNHKEMRVKFEPLDS